MKASELIKELEKAISEHGDKPVFVLCGGYSPTFEEATDVMVSDDRMDIV